MGFSEFENQLLTLGTIAFLVGAAIEFAFLVHYIAVAPAFKSWIGWMFVLRSTSFLLSGVAIIVGRIAGPDYALRPYLTLLLYVVVMVSAMVTYATFIWERRKGQVTRHGSGKVLRFARRALGLKGSREEQHAPGSDDGPRLRIVKEESA